MSPTAGFLLLTVVAVDLVPDAVQENAELGGPLLTVLLPAASTLALTSVLLWRPAPAGCCSRATGWVTALALVGHGLLEGFVVGLGVGVGVAAGLGLLALLAVHRFAEGFALGTTLRAASRRTRGLLVAAAAVTPLVGGDAGLLASPGPRVSIVVTAALAGLLGAAGLRLLAGPSVVASVVTGATHLSHQETVELGQPAVDHA